METAQFRKNFRTDIIPKYYSGITHLIFNFTFLIGALVYLFTKVHSPTISELLAFPLTILMGNLVVFILHRYPLHRKMPLFGFSYKIHAKWHHQFFTDKKLVFDSTKDFYIMFFPTWIILGFVFLALPGIYFLTSLLLPLNVVYLILSGSCFYFISYEVVHFVSHLPEDHVVLKFGFFKYMRDYHQIHHDLKLMRDYNFNIVFPFFDIIFKTYLSPRKRNDYSSLTR